MTTQLLCALSLTLLGLTLCAFMGLLWWAFSMSEKERQAMDSRNKPATF